VPFEEIERKNFSRLTDEAKSVNFYISHSSLTLMVEQQISMPSSQGGLVRYFNEYKSKTRVKPIHVVWAVIAVIVIELALKFFAPV